MRRRSSTLRVASGFRARVGAVVISLTGSLIATASVAGGASTSARTATNGVYPVSVSTTSGSVTITKRPTRIISLSPSATDMLFAIGAGSQVVAVDADSTYPAKAPHTSLSGLSPNVEAISKYNPDLIVVSYLPSGFLTHMKTLGVPVLYEDAATSLANAYGQISALGEATGNESGAASVVASMKSTIAHDVARTPHFSPALTYYYELGEPQYYSATSTTFIGSVLGLFGLKNIANKAPGASSGYPELSAEYIVKSNPDVIFLADTICCGQSAKTVAKRPGWSGIAAVRDDAVVGLNDSLASQWGPRIVDLVASVSSALVSLHKRET